MIYIISSIRRDMVVCLGDKSKIFHTHTKSIMRKNNMDKATGYPFADLTQVDIDSLIAKARVERAEAFRRLFSTLFRRSSAREAPLAEFATSLPARVSPC
jgi:hypothetical protein